MILFDFLYLILLLITIPFWIKFILKRDYRFIIKHRLYPNIEKSVQKRIWLHAVSVGEVRSLKNLIQKLRVKYKDTDIVLSVTTPSGYEYAQKEYPNIYVISAPLDFSFTIKRFIAAINPQLLVLNELEIWPNWVLITNRRKVPILLINGRISDLAFRRYKKTRFFLSHFFKRIDGFIVQADLYKERFKKLKIPREKIKVCGNIKADEAIQAVKKLLTEKEIKEYLGIIHNRKKIVTLASSHRSDEELFIPLIKQMNKDFYFIVVPRHLTRTEEIESLLKKCQVDYIRWTKKLAPVITEQNSTSEALLFDQMGYLMQVLKITDLVIMGGTHEQKIGGHNLYEPSILGKSILGGPFYNNFPDIGKELVEKGVYKVVENKEKCMKIMKNVMNQYNKDLPTLAVDAVNRRKGSVQCILEEIHRYIG